MASVATSNISQIATNGGPLTISGFPAVLYRVASGQTPGDTFTLTNPGGLRQVVSAIGPVTNDLSATAPDGDVVLTILGDTAATIGQFDVLVFGNQSR